MDDQYVYLTQLIPSIRRQLRSAGIAKDDAKANTLLRLVGNALSHRRAIDSLIQSIWAAHNQKSSNENFANVFALLKAMVLHDPVETVLSIHKRSVLTDFIGSSGMKRKPLVKVLQGLELSWESHLNCIEEQIKELKLLLGVRNVGFAGIAIGGTHSTYVFDSLFMAMREYFGGDCALVLPTTTTSWLTYHQLFPPTPTGEARTTKTPPDDEDDDEDDAMTLTSFMDKVKAKCNPPNYNKKTNVNKVVKKKSQAKAFYKHWHGHIVANPYFKR